MADIKIRVIHNGDGTVTMSVTDWEKIIARLAETGPVNVFDHPKPKNEKEG